jgi:hypothetical protein
MKILHTVRCPLALALPLRRGTLFCDTRRLEQTGHNPGYQPSSYWAGIHGGSAALLPELLCHINAQHRPGYGKGTSLALNTFIFPPEIRWQKPFD